MASATISENGCTEIARFVGTQMTDSEWRRTWLLRSDGAVLVKDSFDGYEWEGWRKFGRMNAASANPDGLRSIAQRCGFWMDES